jgi:ABC-type nitrate/sulfonate/bicarbonate transport system permease component
MEVIGLIELILGFLIGFAVGLFAGLVIGGYLSWRMYKKDELDNK